MKKIILSAVLMVTAISFANAQNAKPAEKKCNKVEQCAKANKADADKACKGGKACCKNAADAKQCCNKNSKACKKNTKACKGTACKKSTAKKMVK